MENLENLKGKFVEEVVGRSKTKRYVPTIGDTEWFGKSLPKEEKSKLRSRLRTAMVTNHEDYKTLMDYLHLKFPRAMDGLPIMMNGKEQDQTGIQWDYHAGLNEKTYFVNDKKLGIKHDVYAFVTYDPERDNEPVCVGGSYFKLGPLQGNAKEVEPGKNVVGHGLVLFADPSYRCGLGSLQWNQEAALYRELGIKWQYDIQNEYSMKTTEDMFKNKDSLVVLSKGRVKNDGTHAGIRILMAYDDPQLIEDWNDLVAKEPAAADFFHQYDIDHLVKREGLTKWHR